MFLSKMLRLSRVFILREHPTVYEFLVVKFERVRNSSINITATPSLKYNCVVPKNNHTSTTECSRKFGGVWKSQNTKS